jgi:lipoprotein-anchoring transpeptidase ErfK/SrfK
VIVVSLPRQWWYAYQDGQVVYNGPVTTGRPELPTPVGQFTVLSKQSPFVFVSPWPRGSPFWYETSPCTFALRITGNGVYLHDAPWRPFNGPGTNVPHVDPDGVWRTGSHGCINMPYAAAQWVYGWAPVGTRVHVTA